MPWFSPPDVEQLTQRKDIEGLIRALRYESTRRTAAIALGELGDSSAVAPLVAVLEKADYRTAAIALNEPGDSRARWRRSALVAVLEKAELDQKAAAEALGRIKDSSAVRPLVSAASDSDTYSESVRQSAQHALDALIELRDPVAIKDLTVATRDNDRRVRLTAVRALATIGDKKSMDSLTCAMRDQDWEIRREALNTLDRIDKAAGLNAAQEMLQDERPKVRAAAVSILGFAKEERFVRLLTKALNDGSEEVALQAVRALGKLENQAAREPLLAGLEDKRWSVMMAALRELRHLGWQPCNARECALLAVEERRFQDVAALGEVGTEVLNWALEKADRPHYSSWFNNEQYEAESVVIARVLGDVGNERSVRPLIKLLGTDIHSAAEEEREVRTAVGSLERVLGRVIARNRESLAANDLEAAASLKDRVIHMRNDEGNSFVPAICHEVSCSRIRELASKELHRARRAAAAAAPAHRKLRLPQIGPEFLGTQFTPAEEPAGCGAGPFWEAIQCTKRNESDSAEAAFLEAVAAGLPPTCESYANCEISKLALTKGQLERGIDYLLRSLGGEKKSANTALDAAMRLQVIYGEAGRMDEANAFAKVAVAANTRGLALTSETEEKLRALVRGGRLPLVPPICKAG